MKIAPLDFAQKIELCTEETKWKQIMLTVGNDRLKLFDGLQRVDEASIVEIRAIIKNISNSAFILVYNTRDNLFIRGFKDLQGLQKMIIARLASEN
jgi:hypothetical protein